MIALRECFARWKQLPPVALMAAGLGAMVLLVFGGTLRNGFINLDDNLYVYANPQVAPGFTWEGIRWAFTGQNATGNWHPLTWLSHMLDCQLYGMNASGHHLTNVCLHAVTVVLLFVWLNQLTGAFGLSAWVAVFFAIHPLRVESVAWISERKDVLSGLFFMLTGLLYTRHARQQNLPGTRFWTRDYGLVLLVFALGLMAKPMLVTVPFLLLLLDYWPLQRIGAVHWRTAWWPLLLEKAPLVLLAAAVSMATFLVQQSAGALASPPPLLRLENAATSYLAYLQLTFFPHPLALNYPYPPAIPMEQALVCGAALLLVTGLAVWSARRHPYFLVGWFWYLGMLVPVIGLVQAGSQAMADRYSYLPQIGLLLALVWGARTVFGPHWNRWRFPITLVAGSSVIALMAVSVVQISYWRDSLSIWRHTLACTPPNPVAEIKFAEALEASGQRTEAIQHYQRAIDMQPYHPDVYAAIGLALAREGRFDEAIENYEKEAQLDPDNVELHNNLANLLAQRGLRAEAMDHLAAAIRLAPAYPDAHNNLANLLVAAGRFDEAWEQYQQAIRLQPETVAFHYNFAVALAAHAQLVEAATQFRQVIQLQPDYANAHGNLANVLTAQGQTVGAVEEYRQTIRLEPHSDTAHFKLGLALEQLGQEAEATHEFEQTLQINPQHAGAQARLMRLKRLP